MPAWERCFHILLNKCAAWDDNISTGENARKKFPFLHRDFKSLEKLKDLDMSSKANTGCVVTCYGCGHQKSLSYLNVAILGLDFEAVMLALKDVVAISNGSACITPPAMC